MNVGNYLKKRIIIFIGSFIFILSCVLIVYTSRSNSNTISKDLVVESGGLKVVYQNLLDDDNTNLYPMSIEEGKVSSKINYIKIINTSRKKRKYNVYLTINDKKNGLDVNKIYYCVNDQEPKILGEVDDGKIYSSSIEKNMEDIIDIKFWAGSDLIDNSDSGKIVSLNINVK